MQKSILLIFTILLWCSISPFKTEAGNYKHAEYNTYKKSQYSMAIGFGNSYGGVGLRGQWRSKGIMGFGLHAGLGLIQFDHPKASYGIGTKFFVFKGFYFDYVYGVVGYSSESTYSSNGSSTYKHTSYYGSSLLSGVDWTWGKKTQFGFNAAFGFSKNPFYNELYHDSNENKYAPTLDMGFVMKF